MGGVENTRREGGSGWSFFGLRVRYTTSSRENERTNVLPLERHARDSCVILFVFFFFLVIGETRSESVVVCVCVSFFFYLWLLFGVFL